MTRLINAIRTRLSHWYYERKSRRENPALWRMIDGEMELDRRERAESRRRRVMLEME